MNKKQKKILNVVGKLHQCDEGVTCDEFTTLFMAGISDLPPEIQERMKKHEENCSYHRSSEFHQSMLSSYPDIEKIEEHASEIIKKYMK